MPKLYASFPLITVLCFHYSAAEIIREVERTERAKTNGLKMKSSSTIVNVSNVYLQTTTVLKNVPTT